MRYRLSSSSGNTVGIGAFIGYWEIDAEGYCTRYLEIRSDGVALKYTEAHAADRLGQLPEGVWNEQEASKTEYGALVVITQELFNTVWARTRCGNDQGQVQ